MVNHIFVHLHYMSFTAISTPLFLKLNNLKVSSMKLKQKPNLKSRPYTKWSLHKLILQLT